MSDLKDLAVDLESLCWNDQLDHPGANKEGFVAAEFTVTGPFDDPAIAVKPLTVLTPGITRSIQEVFPDGEK